jgi:hypothetical protein
MLNMYIVPKITIVISVPVFAMSVHIAETIHALAGITHVA